MCHGSNPQIIHVCVSDSAVCVCVWSGRSCTAPNSQTLWSGRPRWQSWHLSLSGWERVVCEWPGAGWDTLNHLHHVSVGLHAWVCTSGCSHMRLLARDHLQMFRLSAVLLSRARSPWNVDACTGASKSSNSYLIYSLFICSLLRNNPMVMHGYENDLTCLCNAALPYRLLPLNVVLWNIHRRQRKITFASAHAWPTAAPPEWAQHLQQLHPHTMHLEHNDAPVINSF